ARAAGRVVLEVQVGQAQLGREPVGADQRRVAGVAPDPSLSGGVGDRQQLLEVPDVARALPPRDLLEVLRGSLVVVGDVQPLAALRAREYRLLERKALLAAVTDEAGRTRARPLASPSLGTLSGWCAHAGTRNDTPGHGVWAPCSSWPKAIHSSSARCGTSGPSIWASRASASSSASLSARVSCAWRAST